MPQEAKRSKESREELQGEFRKIRPPTFEGESEEGAKEWLLNISKYFQLYNYSSNLKARLTILQLNGKALVWWQDLKSFQGISKNNFTWK